MGKGQTPDEMLQDVIQRLGIKYWNISYKPNDWFFPGDLAPHNSSFKYRCAKLYKLGLLERDGDGTNRWGYTYRVPKLVATKE